MPASHTQDDIFFCVDGIRRAEPRPFFTTRVINRFRKYEEESTVSVITRMGWAVTLLIILIIGNGLLLYTSSRSNDQAIRKWRSTTPRWVVEYTEHPGTSVYSTPNP
jgi:hypothetical protein